MAGPQEEASTALVSFSEFSKKCTEKWKMMSDKETGKFEDMAKADKTHYEKMNTYISPEGKIKNLFKDPNAFKRAPWAFLSCSECHPKIKGEHPSLSIAYDTKTGKDIK